MLKNKHKTDRMKTTLYVLLFQICTFNAVTFNGMSFVKDTRHAQHTFAVHSVCTKIVSCKQSAFKDVKHIACNYARITYVRQMENNGQYTNSGLFCLF